MDEIIKLFEMCEDKRHHSAIETNPEFFDPARGINYFRVRHELFLSKLENHEFGETTETGENLDAIQTHNLSVDEASAVYMYTHHHIYENINYYLRNNIRLDKDQVAYIKLLNKGLNKLDSVNNQIIYRDIMSPQDGLESALEYYENHLNSNLVFNDFLSCHTDNVRLSDEEFAFQFVINTSNNSKAKDIQHITFIQNENEVLIQNGTEFRIDEVNRATNKIFISEI